MIDIKNKLDYNYIKIYSHKNGLNSGDVVTKYYDDVYDSKIMLFDTLDENKILFNSDYFNVDSSNKYLKNQDGLERKVEIQNNFYGAICKPFHGYLALILFDITYFDKINKWEDLYNKYTKALDLPTKEFNPLNNGQFANYILIHKGGSTYDYSAGCLTLLDKYYSDFEKYLELNKKFIVEKK